MKKLLTLLVWVMVLFISCEHASDIDVPATGDSPSIIAQQSPIKGVWKCQLNGGLMTLEYGDSHVKYKYYIEMFNATAIYEGTYTITDNVIKHEFTSLTTKNSSRIRYYSLDKMPKEAVLEDDENTIIYMGNSYKRE